MSFSDSDVADVFGRRNSAEELHDFDFDDDNGDDLQFTLGNQRNSLTGSNSSLNSFYDAESGVSSRRSSSGSTNEFFDAPENSENFRDLREKLSKALNVDPLEKRLQNLYAASKCQYLADQSNNIDIDEILTFFEGQLAEVDSLKAIIRNDSDFKFIAAIDAELLSCLRNYILKHIVSCKYSGITTLGRERVDAAKLKKALKAFVRLSQVMDEKTSKVISDATQQGLNDLEGQVGAFMDKEMQDLEEAITFYSVKQNPTPQSEFDELYEKQEIYKYEDTLAAIHKMANCNIDVQNVDIQDNLLYLVSQIKYIDEFISSVKLREDARIASAVRDRVRDCLGRTIFLYVSLCKSSGVFGRSVDKVKLLSHLNEISNVLDQAGEDVNDTVTKAVNEGLSALKKDAGEFMDSDIAYVANYINAYGEEVEETKQPKQKSNAKQRWKDSVAKSQKLFPFKNKVKKEAVNAVLQNPAAAAAAVDSLSPQQAKQAVAEENVSPQAETVLNNIFESPNTAQIVTNVLQSQPTTQTEKEVKTALQNVAVTTVSSSPTSNWKRIINNKVIPFLSPKQTKEQSKNVVQSVIQNPTITGTVVDSVPAEKVQEVLAISNVSPQAANIVSQIVDSPNTAQLTTQILEKEPQNKTEQEVQATLQKIALESVTPHVSSIKVNEEQSNIAAMSLRWASPDAIRSVIDSLPTELQSSVVTAVQPQNAMVVFRAKPQSGEEQIVQDAALKVAVKTVLSNPEAASAVILAAPPQAVKVELKNDAPEVAVAVQNILSSPNAEATISSVLQSNPFSGTDQKLKNALSNLAVSMVNFTNQFTSKNHEENRVTVASNVVGVASPSTVTRVLQGVPTQAQQAVVAALQPAAAQQVLALVPYTPIEKVVKDAVIQVAVQNVLENPPVAASVVTSAPPAVIQQIVRNTTPEAGAAVQKIVNSSNAKEEITRVLASSPSDTVSKDVKEVLTQIAVDMVTPAPEFVKKRSYRKYSYRKRRSSSRRRSSRRRSSRRRSYKRKRSSLRRKYCRKRNGKRHCSFSRSYSRRRSYTRRRSSKRGRKSSRR